MNQVILIGNLTRDPELSYTPNTQMAVCRFDLAVSRPRRNGEDAGADFIRITVWGRQAENCDRYLAKGRQVAVQGRIQTGSYKNREGVTVYTTEVVASNVEFLRGGQGNGGSNGQGGYQNDRGGYSQQGSFGGSQSYGNAPSAFETQDTGFSSSSETFSGFDDMPDTFQAAEDDIPF